MSIHIAAQAGDIAETVLLPGDPLRAQFIAEHFLEKPLQYSAVRNMLGFTGTYNGKRVSVQGTGMGIPSISIYANELFRDYGVKRAIRIGTAGSLQEHVHVKDIILALSVSTDSAVNKIRFKGRDFAPACSFNLLQRAYNVSLANGIEVKVGSVLSSDMFYTDYPDDWKMWSSFGCLAVEMESAELYTLAAKYKREALCILTISDSLISGESTSAKERQNSFTDMMKIALQTASL